MKLKFVVVAHGRDGLVRICLEGERRAALRVGDWRVLDDGH